jgi:hypothetical protein
VGQFTGGNVPSSGFFGLFDHFFFPAPHGAGYPISYCSLWEKPRKEASMADNTKQEASGLSRRDFMRSAAVSAAGAVALAGIMQKESLAAEPAKPVAPSAAAPAAKPAALKIDDVMKAAR